MEHQTPLVGRSVSGSPSASWRLAEWAAKALVAVFLGVHGGAAAVAAVGLLEWLLLDMPWLRLSDWRYADAIDFLQLPLLLGIGGVFLVGYLRRWRHLPAAMAIAYTLFAATRVIQTFGYLNHESRVREMAIECVAYLVILVFLFRADVVQRRLGRTRKTVRERRWRHDDDGSLKERPQW